MKYRFTYVIFNDCYLITEDQLRTIKLEAEKRGTEQDYKYIINDNQKCYQLMKPFAVIHEFFYDKYLRTEN
jgi:hypothetical protein